MKWPIFRLTVLERLMVCFIMGLLFLGTGTSWSFASIGYLCLLSAVLAVFTLCTERRIIAGVFGTLVVACLAIALSQWISVDPLRKKIASRHFESTPLPEVFQYLATQNDKFPHWTFEIYDKELADKRVSLDVPSDATLKYALDTISKAQGCDIDYRWFKSCGNAPTPGSARFCVTKAGSNAKPRGSAAVFIDADHIFHHTNTASLSRSS